MIFHISFYIFSFFLLYFDCKKRIIPNALLGTLLVFLFIFGYFEDKLNLFSFLNLFVITLFYIIVLLLFPKQILGGGDIKYMAVSTLYLEPSHFPFFLIIAGLVQMFFLIYFKKIKKRRSAPMAPAILLAVVFTKLFNF
ncbi:prepilin peptidase [Halarcobacter anaerophilus]|jgi:Flp pilus assembly protein protease CpaA|uniref:Prepilin type IV endopeptidase peptidase domain-containing protein n=1 Tax=Halarcobacter anaerophilus TaxID=877500 RepID=A0A4Q0Y262_9BACT|nr:prepilin peptidase [Halarcobacter anaerophilus]QDF27869.1 prepilin peptidase, putative TadV [Halarcobacter anaerophilus]RXJ64206.1 hypothetical protein CRV06_04535 [Halarcobacter anaerophilus]